MAYTESNIAGAIESMLADAGWPPEVTPRQLGPLDQFHAGGLEATDRLISGLRVGPGSRVLDAGSGLGGVARRIAETTGATVVGIDLTPGYVDAARALTRRCGLDHLVTFAVGDVADPVPGADFDAAVSVHVQMNVDDKVGFFAAVHDGLRSDGRFAIWDVCRTGHDELPWPMPWSLDGTDSHLVSPVELRGAVTTAGFAIRKWSDETAWVNQWFATSTERRRPTGPTLSRILDDGVVRILNFAGEIGKGTLAVVRGVMTA
ncbi:MAG: SAM-dependent methyltransferase [Acidimicrobiales bacterium]